LFLIPLWGWNRRESNPQGADRDEVQNLPAPGLFGSESPPSVIGLSCQKQTVTKGELVIVRTIFVIGAGANAEIGMPDGNSLKRDIAKRLEANSDNAIFSELVNFVRQSNGFIDNEALKKLTDAAMNISIAMPLAISIDNYIDAHRDNREIELCGKMAIIRSILEAERASTLFAGNKKPRLLINAKEKIERLNNSWYPLFFQKISEGCSAEELAARLDDISFIIFNYDRCFEYFAWNALMVYYNINSDMAKETVQGLHIIHPYGTVGELWDDNGELTFGVDSHPEGHLLDLSKKIKTFTESGAAEQDRDSGIKYLVERADRIIFLGFAYHEQNIDLLFRRPGVLHALDGVPMSENIACYGTGYNISEKDLLHVHTLLSRASDKIKECDIANVTCAQFFREFWHRLSFKEP
jgi:hypothetical protein